MTILYSPVTEDVLGYSKTVIPRSAFLICQQSDIPVADALIIDTVKDVLDKNGITFIDAANFKRTGDYLNKILEQIRGSGFCIAVYSEGTRVRTISNIFLEVGMAMLLGKPVMIVKTKQSSTPSDLVRSEYISFDGNVENLKNDISTMVMTILNDYANYFNLHAEIADEAQNPDFELAFEQYMRSFLITGSVDVKEKLNEVLVKFKNVIDETGGDPIRLRALDQMKIHCKLINNN